MNDSVFDRYRELLASVDRLCAGIYASLADDMNCVKKCSSCCMAGLTLFPVEAFHISNRLEKKNPEAREDGQSCVFLKEDLCSIYEYRPIVCRTQGYPLLYESAEKSDTCEISYCGLNFRNTESIDSSCLVNMEAVNSILASLNIAFLDRRGMDSDEDRERRYSMEEIARGIAE